MSQKDFEISKILQNLGMKSESRHYHYQRVLFLGNHKLNFRSTSRDLSCDQNLFDEEISILYNLESIL